MTQWILGARVLGAFGAAAFSMLACASQPAPPPPASAPTSEPTAAPSSPAAPTASAGPATTTAPTPSNDTLVQAVKPAYPKVKECYDAGLLKKPDLTGAVRFRVRVAADGHVEGADDDKSDLPSPEVLACIRSVLTALAMPPFDHPYDVSVPFRLVPASSLKSKP